MSPLDIHPAVAFGAAAGVTVLGVWTFGAVSILANIDFLLDGDLHLASRRVRWTIAVLLGLPIGVGLLVAITLKGGK